MRYSNFTTGYKLENGKVFPLDGKRFNANSVYKNFFEFQGEEESALRKRLKEEISHPSLDELRPGTWRVPKQ
jgi:hypothetical protein